MAERAAAHGDGAGGRPSSEDDAAGALMLVTARKESARVASEEVGRGVVAVAAAAPAAAAVAAAGSSPPKLRAWPGRRLAEYFLMAMELNRRRFTLGALCCPWYLMAGPKARKQLRRIQDNGVYITVFIVVTLFTIIGQDFRLAFLSKSVDPYFFALYAASACLFLADAAVTSATDRRVIGSFFWTLSVFAALLLFLEVPIVLEALLDLVNVNAGRSVDIAQSTLGAGARVARILRIVRLVRLTALVPALSRLANFCRAQRKHCCTPDTSLGTIVPEPTPGSPALSTIVDRGSQGRGSVAAGSSLGSPAASERERRLSRALPHLAPLAAAVRRSSLARASALLEAQTQLRAEEADRSSAQGATPDAVPRTADPGTGSTPSRPSVGVIKLPTAPSARSLREASTVYSPPPPGLGVAGRGGGGGGGSGGGGTGSRRFGFGFGSGEGAGEAREARPLAERGGVGVRMSVPSLPMERAGPVVVSAAAAGGVTATLDMISPGSLLSPPRDDSVELRVVPRVGSRRVVDRARTDDSVSNIPLPSTSDEVPPERPEQPLLGPLVSATPRRGPGPGSLGGVTLPPLSARHGSPALSVSSTPNQSAPTTPPAESDTEAAKAANASHQSATHAGVEGLGRPSQVGDAVVSVLRDLTADLDGTLVRVSGPGARDGARHPSMQAGSDARGVGGRSFQDATLLAPPSESPSTGAPDSPQSPSPASSPQPLLRKGGGRDSNARDRTEGTMATAATAAAGRSGGVTESKEDEEEGADSADVASQTKWVKEKANRGTSRVGTRTTMLLRLKVVVGVIAVIFLLPILTHDTNERETRLQSALETLEAPEWSDEARTLLLARFAADYPETLFLRLANSTVPGAPARVVVDHSERLADLRESDVEEASTSLGSLLKLDIAEEASTASLYTFFRTQMIILMLGLQAYFIQRDIDRMLVWPIERMTAFLRPIMDEAIASLSRKDNASKNNNSKDKAWRRMLGEADGEEMSTKLMLAAIEVMRENLSDAAKKKFSRNAVLHAMRNAHKLR